MRPYKEKLPARRLRAAGAGWATTAEQNTQLHPAGVDDAVSVLAWTVPYSPIPPLF